MAPVGERGHKRALYILLPAGRALRLMIGH
jgi:hypothetical protein